MPAVVKESPTNVQRTLDITRTPIYDDETRSCENWKGFTTRSWAFWLSSVYLGFCRNAQRILWSCDAWDVRHSYPTLWTISLANHFPNQTTFLDQVLDISTTVTPIHDCRLLFDFILIDHSFEWSQPTRFKFTSTYFHLWTMTNGIFFCETEANCGGTFVSSICGCPKLDTSNLSMVFLGEKEVHCWFCCCPIPTKNNSRRSYN